MTTPQTKDVKLPNGFVVKNVPVTASRYEIMIKAIDNGVAKPSDFGYDDNSLVYRIPFDDGDPNAPAPDLSQRVRNPSTLDYAVQGAAAVPIMAAGARGLQAATQGLRRVAPYTRSIAEVLMPKTGKQLAFEGALGAAAGVAGGKAAEVAPEGYKELASIAAGAAVGAPFALGKNAFDMWVNRGLGGEAIAAGNQASQALGQARASAQAMTAIKANPNLVPTVLRASEIEQKTGVSLPMLAAANGDTTISSFLQSQMARGENAEFAAAMKGQYEAAEAALKKAKNGKIPSMQEVDAYVKRQAAITAQKNQKVTQLISARIQSIDDRIQELSASVSAPGRQETGTALKNLMDAKESALYQEIGPKYDELIQNSMKAGIVLPGQSAQNLKNFATDTTNDDVFAKFPTLYGMIKKEFRTPTVGEGTKAAGKYTFAKSAPVPKDIPLNTLDSLKREVNKALRDTTDKDQIRKLVLLKKEVDAAIDTVDPAFSAPYRAIDKEYATRLGIPFSEQGVVNIDRAKFISDTVPQMTKNADSLKQTMAIIGDSPEGLKIVEDAFMFDISNNRSIISTATGELNPAELRRYLAQNKEKIDLVPGLRQKLEGLAADTTALRNTRTSLLEAEKQANQKAAESLWAQAYGTRDGLKGLVRNSLNNPQQLDSILSIAAKDKSALKGIKSALLEDVLAAPGDRMALFANNRQAFEKVFGVPETKNLELLVEASQRLKDNPFVFRMNPATISKTVYEQITGSKFEQSAGEARNHIMSIPRVLINHISRYFQNTANKDEAAEVQRFLLDPKNLEATARLMTELETKGFTDKAKEFLIRLGKNSGSAYLFGGLTGGLVGSQAPSAPEYTPSDMRLLEGFGQPPR